MTKPLLAVLASGFLLVGCLHQNLSKREVFRSTIGRELITQRTTYIYNFQADGYYELWDELYEYGRVSRSGITTKHVEEPLYVVPIGTPLVIHKVVRRLGFDNPPSIRARGVLRLEGKELPISYLWGINDRISKAPWESPNFRPSETISVKPNRAAKEIRPLGSSTNRTSSAAGSRGGVPRFSCTYASRLRGTQENAGAATCPITLFLALGSNLPTKRFLANEVKQAQPSVISCIGPDCPAPRVRPLLIARIPVRQP